jgi:hypothetical protein
MGAVIRIRAQKELVGLGLKKKISLFMVAREVFRAPAGLKGKR